MKTAALRLTILFLFFNIYASNAQFNENLAKEIAALNEKFNLNGIERSNALNTLKDISSEIPESEIESLLPGKTWKYSHSVSNEGRQYRISNAMKRLDFSSDGNSLFKKGKREAYVTTYCKWEYSVEYQLTIDQFENDQRTEVTRSNYFNIHSVTSDRLVLAHIIKSKEHADKSAILFQVYFR